MVYVFRTFTTNSEASGPLRTLRIHADLVHYSLEIISQNKNRDLG